MLLAACTRAAAPTTSQANNRDLDLLAQYMIGSYSSAAQAAADKDYYDIRLHVARIWPQRPAAEGIFLYVEQATATTPQAPYRQRVYRLTRHADGRLESAVYTLRGPKRFVGAWQNPTTHAALLALTPDSLQARAGCSVWLKKTGQGTFEGGTDGQQCSSDLRGAAYARSTVTLTPTEMRSWDQGFDAAGKQVWGATKGGYVFVKGSQ